MKLSSQVALVGSSLLLALGLRAADATTPIDYTQRNSPYAPGSSTEVTPEKQKPKIDETVQEKKVDKTTIDKRTAPQGDKRAAIDMTEAREKNVREKDSHRAETQKIEQPTSTYNHRESRFSTKEDTTKPPTVTKYQDGLTAASATNMARFPAMDKATGARINRFVFRKNPSESVTKETGAVTPAAGGSPLQK